ncbi:hypothetical protein BdWA1_000253 [Babesia duncani]|uniref:Uncharacterized protein n=1 Tax=Babesia duncani TaxID=323732 RepID=A0AAD9PM23_9APIC|nr:hypothetical protein BdWA1_000253 [Babesia duncani]
MTLRVPDIDANVVKALSQPSALHDELVRYILSTVGCKVQNETTTRLVSHAVQLSLEMFFKDAQCAEMGSRTGMDSAVNPLLVEEIKEVDFQVVCDVLQKRNPSVQNYNLILEPNIDTFLD